MGRLIDADKLLEETRKDRDYAIKNGFLDMYYERQALIDRIEAQPTAYDVDKVVEKLEEERELSYADFDRYAEEVSPCLDAEYDDFFHRGLERAIKIVKGGGIDAEH